MARFVEDLILTLPIIAGVDWQDLTVIPMPLSNPRKVDLKSLRIAFHTDNGILSPTPETVRVVNKAVKVLSEAGVAVEEDRPEGIEQSYDIFSRLGAADGYAGVEMLLQMVGTTEMHPWLKGLLEFGHEVVSTTAEFSGLMVKWTIFKSSMLSLLKKYDVIICPVCAYPALPHGATMALDKLPGISYGMSYNLTGWPSVVVRGGTSPEGLPIGVQVVARPWREDVALAVAQHIETVLGGWQPPPL
jgi:amidase